MNYVGKIYSSVRGFCGINSATLTGAIDVIIIRQDDGTYVSSPWHVRFGKMGVIRAKQKVVDIEINGEPVDLHMKLGEAGEAFFVEEAEDVSEVPAHLATSPLESNSLDLMEKGLLEMAAQDGQNSELTTPIIEHSGMIVMLEGNSPVVSALPKQSLAQSLPETGFFTSFPNHIHGLKKRNKLEACTQTDMHGDDVDVQKYRLLEAPDASRTELNSGFRFVMSSVELQGGRSNICDDASMCFAQESHKSQVSTGAEITISDDPTPRKIFLLDPDSDINDTLEIYSHVVETEADGTKTAAAAAACVESSISQNLMHSKAMKDRVSGLEALEDIQFEMELDEATPECDLTLVDRCLSAPPIERDFDVSVKTNRYVPIYQSFSDTDRTPTASPSGSRPSSPMSDTELLIPRNDATSQTHLTGDKLVLLDDVLWKWGEFPETSTKTNHSTRGESSNKEVKTASTSSNTITTKLTDGGIYLDDLKQDDHELLGLYVYDYRSNDNHVSRNVEEDGESGRGVSLPQSPVTVQMESHDNDMMMNDGIDNNNDQRIASLDMCMSLCGGLEEHGGAGSMSRFEQHMVSYDALCNNPNLLTDPNLVIRLSGKYYKWQVACPIVMSLLLFKKPISDRALDTLMKQHMPKKAQRRRGWLWWGGGSKENVAPRQSAENINSEGISTAATSAPTSQAPSPPGTPEKGKDKSRDYTQDMEAVASDSELERIVKREMKSKNTITSSSDETGNVKDNLYKKSLKLSSEQIARLNLNEGENEVTFSVTTQYQGTTRCTCYLFLWNWNDKIVVSDIDGTITRSDVLGQVIPMIGHVLPLISNDWSQVGIARLYSMIASNGYKFLYLSARAIGQSKLTRDYLRSIRQGEVSLPDGPLLLSPSSLVSAFHREVIEKKPEEFKISCLRDIKELFPAHVNPFLAGFGNRINDVWAYTTIGIQKSRIFTVNHKGQLRIETLQSFESSYTRLSDVVDHFFAPLDSEMQLRQMSNDTNEYSTLNYWKNSLPEIDEELDEFLKKNTIDKKNDKKPDKKQDKKPKK